MHGGLAAGTSSSHAAVCKTRRGYVQQAVNGSYQQALAFSRHMRLNFKKKSYASKIHCAVTCTPLLPPIAVNTPYFINLLSRPFYKPDPILCFHFEELNAPDESVNDMLAALTFSLLLFYNSALILFQEKNDKLIAANAKFMGFFVAGITENRAEEIEMKEKSRSGLHTTIMCSPNSGNQLSDSPNHYQLTTSADIL
ncbi:hypothetical protein E5288_WYG016425 [Bos mutus]|uniref:Uncharacterized protein n=1 Tax=Bos mutus TaxID=72004 RepID=A0A6B0RA81_9CETA|nr:hypothetical protein [Bos mutus]